MTKRKWLAVAAAISLGNAGAFGVAHAEEGAENVQPGVEVTADTPSETAQPGTEVTAEEESVEEAPSDAAQPGTETSPAPAEPVVEDVPAVEPVAPEDVAPTLPVEDAPVIDEPAAPVDQTPDAPGDVEPATPVAPVAEETPAEPATDVAEGAGEQAPAVGSEPVQTAPAAPQQDAPVEPVPEADEVLHTSHWEAFALDNSISVDVETTPGLTVATSQASVAGKSVDLAPMSFGTYNDGVVELGIGTDQPAPIKLDPAATAVANALSDVEVPDLNLIPETGDYFFGTGDAGVSVSWT